TIKNALAPQIIGQQFAGVDLLWHKTLHNLSPEEFRRRITGCQIENIRRRGKYFLFDLSDEEMLILHLKMSGVLLIENSSMEIRKHTVAVFRLNGGIDLHFIDQRKFGSLWLLRDENEVIGKLGPEPLEAAFTPAILKKAIANHRIPIKARILDQNAIAGVGNMYADEALFAAGIHPLRSSNDLTDDEIERLHQGIKGVLERGIRHNGASINDYRLPDGSEGLAHTQFRVAHRRDQACPTCGSSIDWIKVRGRGTCFCAVCQPQTNQM
ncbi:MAG: bifunctional DNA-formamidopyrimidine glycosylase/DNA-(apurinic or apyrimidinic site) lyase, partial [Chloroflexota bacterium]|nr:bifunctional DNA-formamidopyrimidine glycosylase/DNA-(apurinic or apyrimidinic site) lyase [Chloroflexota bacterium]